MTGEKSIIIVSHNDDLHAEYIISRACEQGVKAHILNPNLFPSEVQITFSLISQASDTLSELKIGEERFEVSDIQGIWWRRPGGNLHQQGSGISKYVRTESEIVIRSLNAMFKERINWVSDPEYTRLACRKPVQLEVAKVAGFRIPETCITNSPDAVQKFISFLGSKSLTIKPVGSSFIRLTADEDNQQENKVIFTKITDVDTVHANLDLVSNCPVIYQEVIWKDVDIRVTVVDEEVFAAEIALEGCGDPYNLDWRNYEGKRVYRPHSLPEDVRCQCIAVTKHLGLRFGCIDLAFSEREGYTFFEINPQGQWLPSEEKLGYDISGALLRSLLRS